MDQATADFYRHYAEQGGIDGEAARSAISPYFELAFPGGARILDVGSGSGRDLAALRDLAYDAYGIEPNAAMRSYAVRRHPALAGRLQAGSLPLADAPFGGGFDGVVCSAVMMHLSGAELADAWRSIRSVLRPQGRVLVSIPCMHEHLLSDGRDADGRLFQNHLPEGLAALVAPLGFVRIGLDAQARMELPDTTWTILLFALA